MKIKKIVKTQIVYVLTKNKLNYIKIIIFFPKNKICSGYE